MINATTRTTGTTTDSTATSGRTALGKDEFLALLVTQLRYQNPLSPMDSAQFIEQMTGFSTLEQLTNLRQVADRMAFAQSLGQGTSLIGRTVAYASGDTTATGVVERVRTDGGSVTLQLADGTAVDLAAIREVS
ncbi:Flagellar hook capping protein - N-terminal region [Gaiella occulta]|uniref:Flagellar hook capping protein-N-terminal region n=1 Tax=Gaiella occulta TaxID=1002870 RepID=A0A7M2Z1Q3_9ACTN|nr:flagellar hook capping FlgD N-terminal domain-containing protein [Gaiella occulta]RDI75985.1 Flagellar hook capping protein - N-terminal region [Gaiella occulta]